MRRLKKAEENLSRTERLHRIVTRGFFKGDGHQRKGRTIRMWPSFHENDEDVELVFDILSEELDKLLEE